MDVVPLFKKAVKIVLLGGSFEHIQHYKLLLTLRLVKFVGNGFILMFFFVLHLFECGNTSLKDLGLGNPVEADFRTSIPNLSMKMLVPRIDGPMHFS